LDGIWTKNGQKNQPISGKIVIDYSRLNRRLGLYNVSPFSAIIIIVAVFGDMQTHPHWRL